MKQASTSHGFSLVELLLATTIGLILLSGMIAVFSGNKRSSELNVAMANLQENARFAIDKISKDARMAGFQGCIDINRGPATVLAAAEPTADYHATAAQASVISADDVWTPAPPLGFTPTNHNAVPGTHALTLQFGHPSTFPLLSQVGTAGVANRTGPAIINITPGISSRPFDLEVDDYAIISDCATADIFRISALDTTATTATLAHAAPANKSGAFSTEFGAPDTLRMTRVMRFVSNVYYVGDTGLTNDRGDAVTALYQQSLPYGDPTNNPPTELIRGIENMRISFGLRTGVNSLIYVDPSDSRFDPTQVETVRIGLLMNSFDRISDNNDTNTYVIAGQAIAPATPGATTSTSTHAGDSRLRLAFNTTVKVRNRRPTAMSN
ncbi:MAG: PilW family protein [Granulosicoccus sp.]